MAGVKVRPQIERLLSRVVAEDRGYVTDCWIFTGSLNRGGYGQISTQGGSPKLTHCVTYEHFVGPVGESLELDHLCRIHECCNPAHLEPVTHLENIHRGEVVKSRTHCPYGHEFTPENTKLGRTGDRNCRECRRIRQRAYTLTGTTRGALCLPV